MNQYECVHEHETAVGEGEGGSRRIKEDVDEAS